MGKKKKKRYVRIKTLNWDVEYYYDLGNGLGFQITEPAEVSLDGEREHSLYGPQSPLYGTTYGDDQAFIERYRCKCGEFKSRLFEGETCPICHTKVEPRDTDVNMTGWISLGENIIINPYYYQLLSQTLGKKIFTDIIYAKYKITKDGIQERPKDEDLEEPKSSPFSGIGIDEFMYNYESILGYFARKKKNKRKTIKRLLKKKREVFTSHIPIYSIILRPQSVTNDTFYFGSIDKIINTLFTLSENVKNCIPVEKDYILGRIQKKVNAMWEISFSMINGKEGIIRDQLLGGSLNYTARSVIVPDPTLKDDEIDISYHTFLEMGKNRIIYYLMKLDQVTLSVAYEEWKKAYRFSQKVYDIMCYIVEHDDVRMLINRNPTLNYYSMLLMKIRKIKPDDNDYTLSVPLAILPGLNADFDGDEINQIILLDRAMAHMFRKFNPVERMIIDRDSGLLNEYFDINKGQKIDLYYFCTVGETENDQPETGGLPDDYDGTIPEDKRV